MLKKILSTATWKQSQITLIGTLINGAMGITFYILLFRFLGAANYGLVAASIVILTLISDVTDFGTNTGVVRFVSAYSKSNKEKAYKFIKLSFQIKILVWIIVLVFGLLFSDLIAVMVFNKPELGMPLKLVSVGVGGALLFSFATSTLQAFQKFFMWSVVNVSANSLRLISIILLFSSGFLSIFSSLLTYIFFPVVGFFLAISFLPIKQILAVKNEREVSKELFKFNLWVALFVILAAISSRLDTFLVTRFLSNHDVGIYSAANQLVQVVPQIITALGVVAAPKFASFQNNSQMLSYFKKFQLLILGILGVGILILPISLYFFPILYGQEYSQLVATPFVILFVSMLVFLFSLPLHTSILYYFSKPQVFFWMTAGHILIMLFLGNILIEDFGVMGATFTVLIGMIFNFLAPLIWFLFKIRK